MSYDSGWMVEYWDHPTLGWVRLAHRATGNRHEFVDEVVYTTFVHLEKSETDSARIARNFIRGRRKELESKGFARRAS